MHYPESILLVTYSLKPMHVLSSKLPIYYFSLNLQ